MKEPYAAVIKHSGAWWIGTLDTHKQAESFSQYLPVEQRHGVRRVAPCRDFAVDRESGQKRLLGHRPRSSAMLLPAEHDEPNGQEPGFYEVQDEPPDPIDVSPLGPDVEAQPPNDVADLIEQPGFCSEPALGSEACPSPVSLR